MNIFKKLWNELIDENNSKKYVNRSIWNIKTFFESNVDDPCLKFELRELNGITGLVIPYKRLFFEDHTHNTWEETKNLEVFEELLSINELLIMREKKIAVLYPKRNWKLVAEQTEKLSGLFCGHYPNKKYGY